MCVTVVMFTDASTGDMGHVTSTTDPQVEDGDCRYLPREILRDVSHDSVVCGWVGGWMGVGVWGECVCVCGGGGVGGWMWMGVTA